MPRHAAVHVDLDAVAANVGSLARFADPAVLCAVVKADGYGHGAVPVARTALESGARWLAVALVEEGLELRESGVDAPVLVLSQPPADAMADARAAGLTPTLYTVEGIDAAAAARAGAPSGAWDVQLKIDTGMHRVGAPPGDAVMLARRIIDAGLRLGGTFTHLAVADEPHRPQTTMQLERYGRVLGALEEAGHRSRSAPHRQLGRSADPSRCALRPGAGRHRHVRPGTGGASGSAGGAASGHVGAGRGDHGGHRFAG